MNAPARLHLPVVAHADVTAPADRVRCDAFSTVLSAAACAGRTLALKVKPGHRRSGQVVTGVARFAPCARCPLGATARVRLAIAGQPGRPQRINLNLAALAPSTEPAPRTAVAVDAKGVETLSLFGWTRDGATWVDPHGTRFGEAAAAVIAGRERALVAFDLTARAGLSGPPCATPACSGRVRGVHAKTLAALANRCPVCRQYGNLAMRRGSVTAENVAAWLDGLATRRRAAA